MNEEKYYEIKSKNGTIKQLYDFEKEMSENITRLLLLVLKNLDNQYYYLFSQPEKQKELEKNKKELASTILYSYARFCECIEYMVMAGKKVGGSYEEDMKKAEDNFQKAIFDDNILNILTPEEKKEYFKIYFINSFLNLIDDKVIEKKLEELFIKYCV